MAVERLRNFWARPRRRRSLPRATTCARARGTALCQGVAQEGVIARWGLKGARVREKKHMRRASRRRSRAQRDEIRVPLGEGR